MFMLAFNRKDLEYLKRDLKYRSSSQDYVYEDDQ